MIIRPISHTLLCEKLRACILEALRSGVNLETVEAALAQANSELDAARPIVTAALDAVQHGNS